MEGNAKHEALLKSLVAKAADGKMMIRAILVDDLDSTPGANSQSSRSFETLVGLSVDLNSENRPAIRLAIEKPFKPYKALISQALVAAPTAKVLANDIGTVTPSYVGVGVYRFSSTALFTANKTAVKIFANGADPNVVVKATWISTSVVEVTVFDEGVAADALPADTCLEIEVYR